MIVIVTRFPLTLHEDERGWFTELARASGLPKPFVQANLSRSRKGVIRGLHYHERGQDDVFVCLQGMVRVVVLDRESGETFTEDIGDENPVALYVPGMHAHGYEALTDSLFCYLVTAEFDPADPDENTHPWNDPRRRRSLEHAIASPLATGHGRGVLITGGAGQLGTELARVYPEALAVDLDEWDVCLPGSRLRSPRAPCSSFLHAAAWTNVDGAEDDPQGAAAVNVGGTQHVAELGVPLVAFSTDYVFDGRKGEPYVESDAPNPLSAYGRTKLHGEAAAGDQAWIVRSSWLYGPTGHNFVRTMLRLGAERDEVAVVDDQRGCPTYVGHLAAAVREVVELPYGVYHVAGGGECTWADFAEAIFAQAGVDCRVRRITSAEHGARAERPAYAVLRSEKGAPELPPWVEGLRECLEALGLH